MSHQSSARSVGGAFDALLRAMEAQLPTLASAMRPPVPFSVEWAARPGAEQILALWERTSGEARGSLGALGGLTLLGPAECEAERGNWRDLLDGEGLDALAHPEWDESSSRHPTLVRGVYWVAGWIPVLSEPMEANYLAVDLVPLEEGTPGQIILCGRDEDEKCVIAPDLATLLALLAEDCERGAWEIRTGSSRSGAFQYVAHREGRLLSVLRRRATRV